MSIGLRCKYRMYNAKLKKQVKKEKKFWETVAREAETLQNYSKYQLEV